MALFQMRNHPKGLYILFFVEMWERFSYYGMRALLVLYLTKHFLFTDGQAYGIYGAYTTLVYITPVIGGMLADKFLGQRKAVLFGAILLVLGHLGMAFEGEPVQNAALRDATVLNVFYLSLALIVAGVGFLKANISTIVGELYDKTDPRRDGAFTLFYVGINLGAFAGALIAGFLGETFGWKYGFGAAGLGMLAGLVVFVWGKPLLKGAGESPNALVLAKKQFVGLSTEWVIYLSTFVGVALIWFVIRDEGIVKYALYTSMALVYLYIIFTSVMTLPRHPRNRIFVALFLITIQVLFWALFEQAGSSLSLYTDREVDRNIFGQEVVTSVFQSLNAMYIVFLGPLFAMMWVMLGKKGLEPNAPFKFGLGVIQLGLGFLVLVWGAKAAGTNLTPVIFIFLIYLLHTTGELCLSPVGLSAMTRLSAPKMVGLIMGAWFLASGAGNFAAAQIAKLTAAGDGGEGQVLAVYSNVGWVAVAVGVGLIALSPIVGRFMHLETLEADTQKFKEDASE
ncbi:MAG: peptide MFS transporter [Maricaulaceae bacterium]